ncbi:proline-rich protein 36 isoform X11 [Daphnia magna]|uniref:proline-rich protein 36 isoform X11 n=1 Tax=Daphnia magna TaxID=35525 RepID=UPI001E1BDE3F|nr:proline-rich protein 36 isoform X11 [Daphnia magna]
MSLSIWRLVAIFFYITSAAWCQDYQQQKYGEYETRRQYRSAGDEPTTIAPASVTLKQEVPVGNQTLESVTNSTNTVTKSTRDINDMFPSDVEFIDDADVVTLPDGSLALVTDKAEVNTTEVPTVVPTVVPSLVGRDTSKSIVEPFVEGSMDGVNASIEGNKTSMENFTDEAVKMLKRRQAQFFQVPVQPQQIPLAPQFQFQPLPMQQPGIPANQFKVSPPFLFSAQPGQPAIFLQLPPADQTRLAPEQTRFVPSNIPHVVLQQQANVHQGQALVFKQPLLPPKLSLNPVPIPTSTPLSNATNLVFSNGSQANSLKTREAHASRTMHNWQSSVSFKPPPPQSTTPAHPSQAPDRAASVQAFLPVGPPVQRPVGTQVPPQMPQAPAQFMVRPQLQGQQGPPRLGQQDQQTIAHFPRGMDVSPAQFSLQGNQAPPVTDVFNQQPKLQMAPMGSPISQSPSPLQTVNPEVSPPQRSASSENGPPPVGLRMDLPPQPPFAQRSGSPVHQLPQQMAPSMAAPTARPFPLDMGQRSDSIAQPLPSQMPPTTGFPMNQPPTQPAQRSESLMSQLPLQMDSPRGSPVVQPPQFQPQLGQPMGSPMNQPMGSPMNQPMGSPMNQPMGSPMNQPMGSPMNQPMGSPMNQAPQPSQRDPRVGFPGFQMTQQSPPSMQELSVPPSQVFDGFASQVSQLNQRSVHDDRDQRESASRERHMRKRSIGMHHMMRRQLDAVSYPSKDAYDFYVVNHYRNEYEGGLPDL